MNSVGDELSCVNLIVISIKTLLPKAQHGCPMWGQPRLCLHEGMGFLRMGSFLRLQIIEPPNAH